MSHVDLAAGIGRRTQSTIYRDGASGREPRIPTRWHDLLTVAERAMTPEAWAYVAGSSGTESTTAANIDAFEGWRIVPRCFATSPSAISASSSSAATIRLRC